MAATMDTGSIAVADTPLVRYTLQRADDALILGHRLSEWCGHAPMMEEDMALSNMALDLIGQARALYSYAAALEAVGRDEDAYAYLRDVTSYGNLLMVEQPNGDFAHTIVRQFLYSAFIDLYWRRLVASSDATLSAVAAKAEKESAYHLRHSAEWVIRLGDGTPDSHARAQHALDELWPFTGEMFSTDAPERTLITSGRVVDSPALRTAWNATVSRVISQATLTRPADGWMQQGGRDGRHGEHLGHLLSELQFMQRSYPGASW
jgi:ring-1,2-phenylacetyl-CoA epoxidase subunit PaaC